MTLTLLEQVNLLWIYSLRLGLVLGFSRWQRLIAQLGGVVRGENR